MNAQMKFLVGVIALLAVCLPATLLGQYPNVRVSSASSTSPEEVTIAINPANPMNLAAGANLRFYYYSTNGGVSWAQGNMSSSFGVWGDPCAVFDGNGNLYYGHLSNPSSPGYWIDRIVVQKSTSGGSSWNDGAGIGFSPPRKNQDKEWLAVDLTDSPYHNSVYVAWTEFDSYGSSSSADSSRILFSRSTDAGTTWSTPIRLSDRAGDCIDEDNTVEGAVPAVGPNGEVYVAWSGPLGLMFDKSTDGGATFGTDVFVSTQPGGWDYDIPGINRCNGLPITACDVSNSPHRGTIYVNWTDQRNGLDNTDVFLAKSTDSGQTWSPAIKVNDDLTARHQFFSWMTVDQGTGYVYVVFYDRRNTTGNVTDVYVARSTDGGSTFTNFKVSETAFTPTSSIFFGDYTNIAALNGKVYPIWMRLDGSNLSVWTALITDTMTVDVAESGTLPVQLRLAQNYPNPFNPSTTIEYDVPSAYTRNVHVTLTVYDLLGKEVAILVNEEKPAGRFAVLWDGRTSDATGNSVEVASGVYFYRLRIGELTETRKLVVQK